LRIITLEHGKDAFHLIRAQVAVGKGKDLPLCIVNSMETLRWSCSLQGKALLEDRKELWSDQVGIKGVAADIDVLETSSRAQMFQSVEEGVSGVEIAVRECEMGKKCQRLDRLGNRGQDLGVGEETRLTTKVEV
jgi:hypothetical protein